MEVLVQTIAKITEEKGYYIVFLDINGNEFELENITFGRRLFNYRVSNSNPILRSVLIYYGTCNILIPNEDGTIGHFMRHILMNELNGNWVLADDPELQNNFNEEPI